MRVQCPICTELFANVSDITACHCGHTFHSACLAQWRERSNTCPQCRAPLKNRHMIQKLYFNDAEGREEDYDSLRNKNNELEASLHEAKREASEHKRSIATKDAILKDSQNQLKSMEEIVAELRKSASMCKSQVVFLKKENVRLTACENDLIVTKKEIENYTQLQAMIDGTVNETREILGNYTLEPLSFQLLATACSILQKELKMAKSKKERQTDEMKHLKKNLEAAKADALKGNADCNRTMNENQALKATVASIETELLSSRNKCKLLLEKLHEVRWTVNENTSFDRFINESPAPQPSKATNGPVTTTPKFRMAKRAEKNVTEEILTFSVKTSSVAANIALRTKTKRTNTVRPLSVSKQCQEFHIFKRHRQQPERKVVARSSGDQGYDGFGGHSKPDIFPSGSTKINDNSKRMKHSSSLNNIKKVAK